jgi:uncharacterized membrane protein
MSKASLLSLANTLFLVVFIALAYTNVIDFTPILPYKWHRLLHILGAMLFLGNVIVGPIWVTMAIQSKSNEQLKLAFRMLIITDTFITLPTMALIVINGLFMSSTYGNFSEQPEWLIHSLYSLFLLWLLVIPILFIQDKMNKLISCNQSNSVKFKRLSIWWILVGCISFLPLASIFYWMVMKEF